MLALVMLFRNGANLTLELTSSTLARRWCSLSGFL